MNECIINLSKDETQLLAQILSQWVRNAKKEREAVSWLFTDFFYEETQQFILAHKKGVIPQDQYKRCIDVYDDWAYEFDGRQDQARHLESDIWELIKKFQRT